jgi:hypothetical protein
MSFLDEWTCRIEMRIAHESATATRAATFIAIFAIARWTEMSTVASVAVATLFSSS